jgi:hypothetical protein
MMQVIKDGSKVTHKRRFGIGADQVATYIKLGRQKVQGTVYDPYAKFKNPTQLMVRDAMLIASWFNQMRTRWTVQEKLNAYGMITDIQFGPQHYWRTVLERNLSGQHFRAAESWAERHKSGRYVDVSLSPQTRDSIFALLNSRLRFDKKPEPYRAMLDILRFAFHGLPSDDPDNALEL